MDGDRSEVLRLFRDVPQGEGHQPAGEVDVGGAGGEPGVVDLADVGLEALRELAGGRVALAHVGEHSVQVGHDRRPLAVVVEAPGLAGEDGLLARVKKPPPVWTGGGFVIWSRWSGSNRRPAVYELPPGRPGASAGVRRDPAPSPSRPPAAGHVRASPPASESTR